MFSFVLVISNPVFAADLGLISADQLQKTSSEWMIVDARPGKEWLSGHIPGARSFCWEDYTRVDEKGIPYRTMPPQSLAIALGNMGIDNQTAIAIYGDADTSWGGEGWVCWTLSWLGHQGSVRLLNGGIQTWNKLDFPLKTGNESFAGKSMVYKYQIHEEINITAADIRNNPSAFQLVDTRSLFEWIKGRIPGAKHISWEKFYKNTDRRPIGISEVSALLRDQGVDPEKPIVYYCTGGIRSGYTWMVHSLAGLPAAINFEGGMAEWEKLIDQ
jgi:thiosulfate/3-mercaptopyruvate sulfurtransferase